MVQKLIPQRASPRTTSHAEDKEKHKDGHIAENKIGVWYKLLGDFPNVKILSPTPDEWFDRPK